MCRMGKGSDAWCVMRNWEVIGVNHGIRGIHGRKQIPWAVGVTAYVDFDGIALLSIGCSFSLCA